MKPEKSDTANVIFKDTKLNITNEGQRHLGALVGKKEYRNKYMIMRVNKWVTELKLL